MLDLIIKNGKCYIDKDLKDVDIGIQNSKIVKIGKLDEDSSQSIDATGLTVLPGCIDTQTHFREPWFSKMRLSVNTARKNSKSSCIY